MAAAYRPAASYGALTSLCGARRSPRTRGVVPLTGKTRRVVASSSDYGDVTVGTNVALAAAVVVTIVSTALVRRVSCWQRKSVHLTRALPNIGLQPPNMRCALCVSGAPPAQGRRRRRARAAGTGQTPIRSGRQGRAGPEGQAGGATPLRPRRLACNAAWRAHPPRRRRCHRPHPPASCEPAASRANAQGRLCQRLALSDSRRCDQR